MASSPITKADQTRLSKLLGMLGSAHAGERDAAALAATRFVRDRNLTWSQVLAATVAEKSLPQLGTWRTTAARCLERPGCLRPWEMGFLRDLPQFRRLSVKQRYVLKEIADRVLGAGAV